MGEQQEENVVSDNKDMESESLEGAVDVSPAKDGGIMKVIKKEGCPEFGRPIAGDNVSVHYVGTLTDGTKFDSSRDRGEYFTFNIGKGEVIKAWDHGVATMYKGELAVFTCKSEYAYGDTGAGEKIPPGATLIFEVELFDWKGEDLSPDKDEGIMRSTIEKGSGYTSPVDNASVEVHVTGKYNGVVFEDRDVTFILGEGSESGVVEGVEIALKKFKNAEKSTLKIKAKYAYGTEGHPEYKIPPRADLLYQVTLKSFEKAKEAWEMDSAEKLEQSSIMKQKGTDFFKSEKYKLAVRYYKKVIDILEKEDTLAGEEAEKRTALMLAGFLNSAMCHLKMKEDYEAITACDQALELDSNNEKALFRKATAYMNLHDYSMAKENFQCVLKIDPANKAAKNQVTIANAKIQQIAEKEKKVYAGMFQKFAEADAKKEKEQKAAETSPENVENGTTSEESTNDSETKEEEGASVDPPGDSEPMEA